MKEPCNVCGKTPGQCVEARDAGNFVISVFMTPEGPSHCIPLDDLHRYDMSFRAILVGGPTRIIGPAEVIE